MAEIHGGNIVTDGLVLYLDAANVKSYSGTGNIWYDLSDNNYNFNSLNMPSFVLDNNGNYCFEYIGAGKYFDSISNSPFSGNNFSISVIAILNQFTTGNYYGILTQHEQSTTNSMAFLSYNGRFGTDHWSPGGKRLIVSEPNNIIQHISWVVPLWSNHQTNTKIYVNGVEKNTETYSPDTVGSLVSNKFRIGNWQLNRSDMDFQGRIYKIMVYNRALTIQEIQQNFNATKSRYSL